MNLTDGTSHASVSDPVPTLDLTSASFDLDDHDAFSLNFDPSFGSQVGKEEPDDDEDEDTADIEGEDENGDDVQVSSFKKT
jgi:hypothetical protein